jgi:hypothetical protein
LLILPVGFLAFGLDFALRRQPVIASGDTQNRPVVDT